MERAGNLRKRANVWSIPALPRFESTRNSPSKFALEKKILSIRSANTIRTATARATTASGTPQSSSSSQKQPGKENELPLALHDNAEKFHASIINKTTGRRKKTSSPTKWMVNLEKDRIRRRLSCDYEDQLCLKKFHGESRVLADPIHTLPPKVIEPLETDVISRVNVPSKFSIYDDEKDSEVSPLIVQQAARGEMTHKAMSGTYHDIWKKLHSSATPETLDSPPSTRCKDGKSRQLGNRASSMSELAFDGKNIRNDKSATAMQECRNETGIFDSNSIFDGRMSGKEFRIERIDSQSMIRAPVANNMFRKVKSGSDIGRLKVPLRRGDDISPLKRRINQSKKNALLIGGKIRVNAKERVCPGAGTAEPDNPTREHRGANLKMGSKDMDESRKAVKPKASCLDRTRKRKYHTPRSVADALTGAMRKTNVGAAHLDSGETAEGILVSEEMPLLEVGGNNKIWNEKYSKRAKPGLRSVGESVVSEAQAKRNIPISNAFKFLFGTGQKAAEPSSNLSTFRPWDSIQMLEKEESQRNARTNIQVTGAKALLEFENMMPTFCQPARREKSSDQKDNFIESMYDDLLHNNEARLQWTNSIFQGPLPSPLDQTVAEVQVPGRVIKKRQRNGDELSNVSSSRTERKSAEPGTSIGNEIQYTTDYTHETIHLERAREGCCYKISETFLKGKAVTPMQRRIVVNFLINVHAYLSTSSSTLYQSVKIFDSILDIKDVSVEELQLVALGASWIAIKNMETTVPTATEMISFAKDMYQIEGPKLLCRCERRILKALRFNIRFPDPFYISAYCLQLWTSFLETAETELPIRRIIYHSASYLMDVALLNENYSRMPAELLAAATTETATRLALGASRKPLQIVGSARINEKMQRNCSPETMDSIVGPLLKGVLDLAENDSVTSAVYKKYKSSKYDNIGEYLVTEVKKLFGLTLANRN